MYRIAICLVLFLALFTNSVFATNGCNLGTDPVCGAIPVADCDIVSNTTFNPGTYYLSNGVDICSSGITLDCNGSKLIGLGTGWGIGIHSIYNLNNITIKNCEVKNWGDGLRVSGTGLIIRNNRASYNLNGMGIYTTTFSTIDGNIFDNNSWNGYTSSGVWDSKISNNQMSFNGNDGIYGTTVYRNYYQNNILRKNNFAGIELDRSNYENITGNVAEYNSRGIQVQYSSGFFLQGNTANNNSNFGIIFTASSSNYFFNNIGSFNSMVGWGLYAGSSNNFAGNNSFCFNAQASSAYVDIYNEGSQNAGEQNTCNTQYNWQDFGVASGCTYTCPPPNTVPILSPVADSYVFENQELLIQLSGYDAENNTLIYATNAGGVLPSPFSFDANAGLFTWTPTFTDSGEYFVEFNVTDGEFSDGEIARIVVQNLNRPPILEFVGNQIVNVTETLTIDLAASDPDGDFVTFGTDAASMLPAPVFFDGLNGVLNWIAPLTSTGTYQTTFWAWDGQNQTNETITISSIPGYGCGDVNKNWILDVLDVVGIIDIAFRGEPAPDPEWIADVDGNGDVNVIDVVKQIDYVFRGGEANSCGLNGTNFTYSQATITLGSATGDATEKLVPIYLSSNMPVSVMKFDFSFDASKVTIGGIVTSPSTSDFATIRTEKGYALYSFQTNAPGQSTQTPIAYLKVKAGIAGFDSSSLKISAAQIGPIDGSQASVAIVNPGRIGKLPNLADPSAPKAGPIALD